MDVLVYLLADPLSVSPETGPHGTTRILFGRCKTDQGDEEHLLLFSNILLDLERGRWALGLLIAFYYNTNRTRRGNFRCSTQKSTVSLV
jgi:hypothetical protein